MTSFRWTIAALLFFATTFNYLDRVVISLLKSTLSKEFNWDDGDYADLEITFKIAYAIGLLGAGAVIDKLGTRKGYALATITWSLSAMAHAFVSRFMGFAFVRASLGISEAGNFPAAVKTVAEWFPKKERAFATGIFNSGAGIGAVIAPLTVPFIAIKWGWQWAFFITGAMGFIWLIFWFFLYDVPAKHRKVSKTELEYINNNDETDLLNQESVHLKWISLFKYKQTWAFIIGKFLTDPIWWFYLFWLPDFLESQYHLSKTGLALPVAIVYVISTAGSVGGGWLPMKLIQIHWPVFKARKYSMLFYALLVMPVIFAQILGSINMWYAVLVIGIATAAHQAWSANIYTIVSDMFPKSSTASVTGLGGMSGTIGSILLSILVQKQLFVHFRSIHKIETAYYIMFFVCGAAYLLAWMILHLLVPKFKPVLVQYI